MAEFEHVVEACEWDEPPGQAHVVRGLWRAARAGRLPHALLFRGPAGVGKLQAARWFTLGLFCERGLPGDDGAPCGVCGACKRLRAGSHADCFLIDVRQEPPKERSEELRIGRFVRREGAAGWKGPVAEEFLSLRAAEGGWRALHVREMERANEDAQTSILKLLEEPAARVLWILECSRPERLLPTIHSRCVQVRFEPLSDDAVERALLAHGVEGRLATPLARWSAGSPGEAVRMWEERAWEVRALLVEVLRGSAPPLVAALALWQLEGAFEGKTAKAQERARLRPILDLALALLGTLERAAAGAPSAALAHGDVAALEPPVWLAHSAARRGRALETLIELRRDVERNVDPAALLDRALLELAPPAVRSASRARGAPAK